MATEPTLITKVFVRKGEENETLADFQVGRTYQAVNGKWITVTELRETKEQETRWRWSSNIVYVTWEVWGLEFDKVPVENGALGIVE